MRIAFLVQCHKNPAQVALLAESLLRIFDCHVFLHGDRKSHGFREQVFPEGVTLLPEEDSVLVSWGTFSQCRATLALIRAALASGQRFDYLWLISGQDLPIAGREIAMARFSGIPQGTPFMEVMERTHPLYPRFEKRNQVYYPRFLLRNGMSARILRRCWQLFTGGRGYTFPVFRRAFPFPRYYGSSWWCLPSDCAAEMMAVLESWEGWEAHFANSLCPDESFFQTLFMQTAFAGKQQPMLTYVDWTGASRSPRTFTRTDLPRLWEMGGKYLLARKFDMELEPELCERLLNEL